MVSHHITFHCCRFCVVGSYSSLISLLCLLYASWLPSSFLVEISNNNNQINILYESLLCYLKYFSFSFLSLLIIANIHSKVSREWRKLSSTKTEYLLLLPFKSWKNMKILRYHFRVFRWFCHSFSYFAVVAGFFFYYPL